MAVIKKTTKKESPTRVYTNVEKEDIDSILNNASFIKSNIDNTASSDYMSRLFNNFLKIQELAYGDNFPKRRQKVSTNFSNEDLEIITASVPVFETVYEYLSLDEKIIDKSTLYALANVNENTAKGYFIKKPTGKVDRDKIISLCYAMLSTVEQTNTALEKFGLAKLNLRNRRDLILINAFAQRTRYKSIEELNAALIRFNEVSL